MSPFSDSGAIRSRSVGDGIEIIETSGLRSGYASHSHDRYVVGLTRHGVQRFRYRGEEQKAVRGEAFVLHPGETHDGRPGTKDGYGYRSLHVSPRHIAEAIGGRRIPFVKDAVSTDRQLAADIVKLLEVEDTVCSDIEIVETLADLAHTFERLSGQVQRQDPVRYEIIRRIREQLHSEWRSDIHMADLEVEHGLSRYTIARQFRRYFGVSPSRYVILRRLDKAKRLIAKQRSLADAAYATGFSDQSHMTRHFLQSFGMTPGRWRDLSQSRNDR